MRVFLLLILAIGAYTTGLSQEDPWTLAKDREGIQVYTREVKGSEYKAFRAITEIACTKEAAIRELKALESFSEWYHQLTLGKKLTEDHPDAGYCYMTLDMPWPVADRDNIFYYRWEQREGGKRVILHSESRPDYLPPKTWICAYRFFKLHLGD